MKGSFTFENRRKEMKRFFALSLVLMMSLSLVACGTTTGGGSSKTLKIGVFEPASGDNGAGGKQETLGMEYANSVTPTIEINGATYKVELKIVDNQSSTDKAPTAAQELISAGVSVVLGSYGSGVSMAAAPIFDQAKIPAIGASCTNPAVTQNNPYYYRVCFIDPFQGSVMASFDHDQLHANKAYVLTMLGEDYGSGLGTYFTNAFKKLGGSVKAESFPEGTSDFSAYIQNAVSYGADVIFAPSATTYASLIIGQAASAGLKIPITAGDTWESSVILDAQKGTNLNVYLSTFFDENDKSGAASTFVTGFKQWLNADPQRKTDNGGNDIVAAVSALGYDAYMTAIEAIKIAQSTKGEDINAAMPKVNFNGVTGNISFPNGGDAVKTEAFIKKANNGAFEFVKRQSVGS
jgi:branched-chain amino acid transport system substrate-binding protein